MHSRFYYGPRPHLLLNCFGVVFLCFSLSPSAQARQIPQGVFCLMPSGGLTGKDPQVLNDPNVDGITIRQDWSALEPAEGKFDWRYLDDAIGRAAAAGKPVLLRIGTQANKPAWVTKAAQNAGGRFFSFDANGVRTTIPVFWDPTYLNKKTAMIRALGRHFGNNPAVKIVSASFANAQSEDWAVPHTVVEVKKWLALGYTSQRMLDAGKQIIDATMTAFPTQYVALAVGTNGHVGAAAGPNLDPDENYVARHAVEAARSLWPGRLIVQKNTFQANGPEPPAKDTAFQLLWDSRPDVAGQMVYWCYGDRTYRANGGVRADPSAVLRDAASLARRYGVAYLEIYRTDIVHLAGAAHYAHNLLTQP